MPGNNHYDHLYLTKNQDQNIDANDLNNENNINVCGV